MTWEIPFALYVERRTTMLNQVPHLVGVAYVNLRLPPTCLLATFYWKITHASYNHYSDVIVGAMASQITSLTIVYSTVYSGADQRKHQSSASLASVRGIHRWPVNSPHKGPVTRKMFPFDDVIMSIGRFTIFVEFNVLNCKFRYLTGRILIYCQSSSEGAENVYVYIAIGV